MMDQFRRLLSDLAANSEAGLSSISFNTEQERELLIGGFNESFDDY